MKSNGQPTPKSLLLIAASSLTVLYSGCATSYMEPSHPPCPVPLLTTAEWKTVAFDVVSMAMPSTFEDVQVIGHGRELVDAEGNSVGIMAGPYSDNLQTIRNTIGAETCEQTIASAIVQIVTYYGDGFYFAAAYWPNFLRGMGSCH
jgi:hypothetical protein